MSAYFRADQWRFKLTWEGLETLALDACMRPLSWSYAGNLYRRGLDGTLFVDSAGTSVHETGPKEWQVRIGKIPVAA